MSLITADTRRRIATGEVTNAMLAGSISYGKLSLTGAILNADLAGSIAYSKLVLTGAILNADLAGSIADAKILSAATWNAKESALTFFTGLTRATNTITNNLSTGVSGGQTAIGGTASGNSLTLSSTSHATKGKIYFGSAGTSAYDEVNDRLGIGTASPAMKLNLGGTELEGIGRAANTGRLALSGAATVDATFGAFMMLFGNANTADATRQGAIQFGAGNISTGYVSIHTGNFVERIKVANNGNTGFGQSTPTALIHIKAGTATANTAPFKLTSGTNLTTAETGAIEYNGTNLFFTRTGTTRETVMCANAVNSVNPTAPNRTITVVIAGTTYYLAAKTTND